MGTSRKIEVFIGALLVAGLVVVAGVSYFVWQGKSGVAHQGAAPVGYVADAANTDAIDAVPASMVEADVPSLPTSTAEMVSSSSQSAAVAAKILPYDVTSFSGTDWNSDWGMESTAEGTLNFGAASGTEGGDSFLSGSGAWTNYDFEANVQWTAGQTFSMVARSDAAGDFVYCDFSDQFVAIIDRTDGNDETIASATAPNGGAGSSSHDFGMQVFGDDVACVADGKEVASAAIAGGLPAHGGIGFISFDKTPGLSAISILGVHVAPLADDPIVIPLPARASPAISAAATPSIITPTSSIASPVASVPAIAQTQIASETVSSTAPSPASSLSLPYVTDVFTAAGGWDGFWGDSAAATNSLPVAASEDSTSGGALLSGSDAWTDYTFTANLDWVGGETFGLIARYVDPNDYVVCTFSQPSPGYIDVDFQQYIGGVPYTLVDDSEPYGYWPTAVDASIQVQGNHGQCSFSSGVASSPLEPIVGYYLVAPWSGRIGFMTWDPTPGTAKIVVNHVSVTQDPD